MVSLFIADKDDPDVLALTAEDSDNSWTWLQLGQSNAEVDISIEADSSSLRLGTVLVTQADLPTYDHIVFRRWKVSPPHPTFDLDVDTPVARYILREWETTLRIMLERWYRLDPPKWSRRPGEDRPKVVLIDRIRDIVQVPEFSISNLPRELAKPSVLKPISNNQHFDGSTRVSTIEADPGNLSHKSNYPRLIQRRIEATHELRLSYCFGKVAVVAQYSEPDAPVDRRYSLDVRREQVAASASLRSLATEISQRIRINMFTADILVDDGGSHWWVDINPDGLHIAADDTNRTLVANLRAGI